MDVARHSFADYKTDAASWITLATGEYYPDILAPACQLYEPVLRLFGHLLSTSESSARLFIEILAIRESWMRIQLLRVFRKYVSPRLPVEMLKRKQKAPELLEQFGARFRTIQEVQKAFDSRPIPDEALSALLWEYKNRGQEGYDLTERFFALFRTHLPDFKIMGPERAGTDIRLGTIFPNYPNPKRPVDFVIYDTTNQVLAIGLARYDSDRGGAQEDDRTGGYHSCADEILGYASHHQLPLKLIFVNDGPGLLLGSMWDDYAALEASWPDKIRVVTLRMVVERLTQNWLLEAKK
jgi:hypothetical protein